MASPRPEPNNVLGGFAAKKVSSHGTKVSPIDVGLRGVVRTCLNRAAERKRILNMTNPTSEVKHTRGWLKYLAVSGTALLLAACSSGLVTNTPTTQDELAPQASSCLNRHGNKIKLRNNRQGRIFHKKNVIVDARGMTFRGDRNAFVGAYNHGFLCISGGTYVTSARLSMSWAKTHGMAAFWFRDTPNLTLENAAIGVGGRIAGDGFGVKENMPNWTFRNSYVGRAGDDGIENDRYSSGTADNVLIDSAFTGLSCRAEGRGKPRRYNFNVKNTLISLKGRSNDLFKVSTRSKNYCKLNLSNNVFYLPKRNAGKIERKVLNGGSCRNNTIVYTGGSKSYLNYLKRNSSSCFKVTTDKRVWERARDNWFKRHSQFSKYR